MNLDDIDFEAVDNFLNEVNCYPHSGLVAWAVKETQGIQLDPILSIKAAEIIKEIRDCNITDLIGLVHDS